MLRDKIRKNEEKETELLFNLPENMNEENDQECKHNKLLENNDLERIEEEKTENQNDNFNELSIRSINFKSKNFYFTPTFILSMFATMIGTAVQFGYAIGVMNAPSQVNIQHFILLINHESFFLL